MKRCERCGQECDGTAQTCIAALFELSVDVLRSAATRYAIGAVEFAPAIEMTVARRTWEQLAAFAESRRWRGALDGSVITVDHHPVDRREIRIAAGPTTYVLRPGVR